MIFVTVGSVLGFDRLIEHVDDWAERTGRNDIFAQIGPSDYQSKHIETVRFMEPGAFREKIREADGIVAHAGMGTIIESLEREKPILVFPRLAALGEHRNDHQISTAKQFERSGRILAAYSTDELDEKLESLTTFRPSSGITSAASAELIDRIRQFVFND